MKYISKSSLKNSIVPRAFRVFSKRDRKKLYLVAIIQIALSFLDLIGVMTIGLLGALTVSGIQSQSPNGTLTKLLKVMRIEDYTFQGQIAVLGTIATFIFLMRTFSSIFFNKKILLFLANRTAATSSRLIRKLLALSPLQLQANSTQELLYAITNGVNNITVGIIGTVLTLVADTSVFAILSVGLFVIDPLLAFSSSALFAGTAIFLYKVLQVKARNLGSLSSEISIKSNEKVIEVLTSYRETIIRGRRNYYVNSITEYRNQLARVSADLAFLPNISKYVIETLLVVGTLVICAIQFMTKDAIHAIGILSVFIAAGTRIAPAVLRIQQGAMQIKTNVGSSGNTLALIEELNFEKNEEQDLISPNIAFHYPDFSSSIRVSELEVTYPGNSEPTLKDINLELTQGSTIAIVGPSGAGKTTLIDSILGLIEPSKGMVSISGMSPLEAIERWPGAVAYVPQNIFITNGSILDNITLGFSLQEVDMERVTSALEIAQLSEFVDLLPEGIHTNVGEFGSRISGGQRQRLGIARAMYSNPKLIVLDEATSALDGITEEKFSQTLAKLKGSATVILIAHRLTSVKLCETVAYLRDGRVVAKGTFNQVAEQVPEFIQSSALLDSDNS